MLGFCLLFSVLHLVRWHLSVVYTLVALIALLLSLFEHYSGVCNFHFFFLAGVAVVLVLTAGFWHLKDIAMVFSVWHILNFPLPPEMQIRVGSCIYLCSYSDSWQPASISSHFTEVQIYFLISKRISLRSSRECRNYILLKSNSCLPFQLGSYECQCYSLLDECQFHCCYWMVDVLTNH